MAEHHPILRQFQFSPVVQDEKWLINVLGVRQRACYYTQANPTQISPEPVFNEEYFEWIDVLESVLLADEDFTMIELGAGFGRWLVNAAAALRQIKQSAFYLVGVEAEPTHFAWLTQHLEDNGIDPHDHLLIQGVISAKEGSTLFHVGKPGDWYGQSIWRPGRKERLRMMLVPWMPKKPARDRAVVPTFPLTSILDKIGLVDLLDMDIQGEEGRVVRSSIERLNRQVRRVHIGTHSRQVEKVIRREFLRHRWINLNDYPSYSTCDTLYGQISFEDGVQTWINPRLSPAP